jgi:S1-C subfamily serine protease
MRRLLVSTILLVIACPALAQQSFTETAQEVNKRVVKVYGSGGYRGLPAYGSGILISNKGHILTSANHLLDTQDLRIHLYDGTRYHAKVVVIEPVLDAAILKLDIPNKDEFEKLDLTFFDVQKAMAAPPAQAGDWVLAFSNQFQIATRDEPLSIQRGTIACFTKLHGRRGIFDASYTGEVYVVDAIMNNPGAAGGALTSRKGELLGIIGKELKNTLSETWINYAVPINARVEVKVGDRVEVATMKEFLEKGPKGEYKVKDIPKAEKGIGGYHGIVLVPNVVERTPPFVDGVRNESPAQKSGLSPDDLIVYVDGEPVSSINAFNEYIAKTNPGMTIRLEVRRGDKLMPIEVKLDEHPKKK